VYENEHEVGKAIAKKIKEGVVKRADLFITSKVNRGFNILTPIHKINSSQLWNCDHDADRVVAACKRTLAALGLEYLDLYLVHWPMAFKAGKELMPKNADGTVAYSNVHFTTTWPKMEECVTSGLAKSIGLSNFNSKQIDEILGIAKIRPVTNQV